MDNCYDYEFMKSNRIAPKIYREDRDAICEKYYKEYHNSATYEEKEFIKLTIIKELINNNVIGVNSEDGEIYIPVKKIILGSKNSTGTLLYIPKRYNINILRSRFIWYSIHDTIIPKDHVLSHIDGNVYNDRLDNLEVLPISEHNSIISKKIIRTCKYTKDNPKIIPECSSREAEIEFFNRVLKGDYNVNIHTGEIKNNITGNVIGRILSSGYSDIGFYYKEKTRQILKHRIIWMVANNRLIPDGYQVNHIDGNKLNNCYTNLELVTPKENTKHAFNYNLRFINNGYHASKLTFQDAEDIRNLFTNLQWSKLEISNKYNVSISVINDIINYRTFKFDYSLEREKKIFQNKFPEAINSPVLHNVVTNMSYKKHRRELLASFKERYKEANTYEEREHIKLDIVKILLSRNVYRIDYNTGKIYAGVVELGAIGKYAKMLVFCDKTITISTPRFIWYSVHDDIIPKGFVLVHKNNNYYDDRLENLEVLESNRSGIIHKDRERDKFGRFINNNSN